jgi:hypothetical protein
MKTKNEEKVSITLSDVSNYDDHSVAKISVGDSSSDAYVSNSISLNVSSNEEHEVWINISGHTYTTVPNLDEPFTTHHDYLSHHFTEAEARALLALLVHELGKLDN